MTDNMYLIEALQLENAALRARIAELIELLSAAQDACDQAEAAQSAMLPAQRERLEALHDKQ